MIEGVALAHPRYRLHFMLVDRNPSYMARLRELAARIAPERVSFDPAVAPGRIVESIARFDIGIFILAPHGFNARMALPNKLFEFIAAGLAVCIGPSIEMARIVNRYSCGVVTDSFEPEACADALNALTPATIDRMKRHSIASRAELNAANEAERVWRIVERALAS
jgi:glycosyltransferase involved in cell wall biosynthesis